MSIRYPGRPQRPFQLRSGHKYYQCTVCMEWKPYWRFYRLWRKQKQNRCGRQSECKVCNNVRRKMAA